jgi:hypothetical protein
LDLTQEQAAGILEISSRTIITWEKMETPIKRHVMLACLYIEDNPGIVRAEGHEAPGRMGGGS